MAVCTTARVTQFDTGRGTGSVVTDDGRELAFHSTRVADGSRSIDVGVPVVIEIGPGAAPGSWEATRVLKIGVSADLNTGLNTGLMAG